MWTVRFLNVYIVSLLKVLEKNYYKKTQVALALTIRLIFFQYWHLKE